MKCDQCGSEIDKGDQRDHLGQILCEDCYMDALSPVKTCDPWATHCAKSFEQHNNDPDVLSSIQRKILDLLEKNGGLSPEDLLVQLGEGMTRPVLEREFATLKHMNRVGAEKTDQGVVLKIC